MEKWVLGPYDSYHLTVENKDMFTYPIDGWYWFNTIEEAYAFFDIPYPPVVEE